MGGTLPWDPASLRVLWALQHSGFPFGMSEVFEGRGSEGCQDNSQSWPVIPAAPPLLGPSFFLRIPSSNKGAENELSSPN